MEQITNIWPHDLLTFAHENDLILEKNPLPEWAKDSLSKAKIVVVRRGIIKDGLIPVGIRGKQKNQRLGCFLPKDKILKQYHPDYFIRHQSWTNLSVDRQKMPAFQALNEMVPVLKDFHWGVSGSLAYEMATGVKMVHQTSDIDVIAWQVKPMSVPQAQALLRRLNQFNVHADMQVVNQDRGFALEEYAMNRDAEILIKTDEGPCLSDDPWHFIEEG